MITKNNNFDRSSSSEIETQGQELDFMVYQCAQLVWEKELCY